jgi:hypothetical protein
MPRPQTTGAGTAWVATGTAWQSIGARSVPGVRNPVKPRKGGQLETLFRQFGQSAGVSCATRALSATLRELMGRARSIGKVAPAIIAPFAAPAGSFAPPSTR